MLESKRSWHKILINLFRSQRIANNDKSNKNKKLLNVIN